MTISGMKDNPYGFGQPIDQPALSLSVSYLQNLQINRQIHISFVGHGRCR